MSAGLVIVIGGPTASGKTDLAIALAEKLHTEIISADSRQVYSELNIGVARPTPEQLARVKHHLIACRSITMQYNAGQFAAEAENILQDLLAKRSIAVVCGGTGLYIKALLQGMDALPEVPANIRAAVTTLHRERGLEGLQQKLLTLSPESAALVEMSNPARVMRALELAMASDKPLSQLWKNETKPREFEVLGYYLNPPREMLYRRINERTEQMFHGGLVDEVKKLSPFRHLPALNTVGYAEVFDYLDGKCDLQTCIARVQQHTRNYAKRQLTWFKNTTDFKAIDSDTATDLIFDDLNTHGYPIHQ